MTLLVTGATGNVGRQVARLLVDEGARVRALVRDTAKISTVPAGVEIAIGDYGDPAALAAALVGVSGLFMVCLSEPAPGRLVKHRNVVRAARRAGVGHLVYLSFLRPSPQAGFPQARWHADTEAAIDDAGIPRTFLRVSLYQSSLLTTAGIVEQGRLLAPAGQGQVAAVAREDVAAVAAVALSHPASDGQAAYDVTGPELLTWHEIAHVVGAATGTSLRHEEITSDDYATRLHRAGRPDALVQGLVGLFADIRDNRLAARSDIVQRLTGHAAASLADTLNSAQAPDEAPRTSPSALPSGHR